MPPAKRGCPTILVTDARLGSAVAIVRSLGRQGWRVIAADSIQPSPGLWSRYAKDRLLYPPPETAPRSFVDTLLRVARGKHVDLIIPVADQSILPISAARDQFAGLCQLALPEAAALDVAVNKLKTLQLAERLGVPAPRTHLVRTVSEALAHGPALGWPVVLKPQASQVYRCQAAIEEFAVGYAESQDQLRAHMGRFEGRCSVLLQEYYPGVGHGVELLLHQGRVLAAFQHRRLRELPLTGGASTFRESVRLDPELYAHASGLLRELNWTGLAMVEFKLGARGAKLMEINGRVWGSLPLAVFSGMDFPRRLVELYLDGPPDAATPVATGYRAGVRARNFELELAWIAHVLLGRIRCRFVKMPKRRKALAALLGFFNPASRFDILSWSDLLPGAAELIKILGKVMRKAADMKKARKHSAVDQVDEVVGVPPQRLLSVSGAAAAGR